MSLFLYCINIMLIRQGTLGLQQLSLLSKPQNVKFIIFSSHRFGSWLNGHVDCLSCSGPWKCTLLAQRTAISWPDGLALRWYLFPWLRHHGTLLSCDRTLLYFHKEPHSPCHRHSAMLTVGHWANIKRGLSLAGEWEPARNSPDRTNGAREGGNSLPVSSFSLSPLPATFSKTVNFCWVQLVYVISFLLPVFGALSLARNVYPTLPCRSTSTSAWRLAEKPGQETQLITVDEKLVRIPPSLMWNTGCFLPDVALSN